MPSVVSQADAMVKIAAVVPEFAGTSTFWEQLGFDDDVRRSISNEIRRQQAKSNAAASLAAAGRSVSDENNQS